MGVIIVERSPQPSVGYGPSKLSGLGRPGMANEIALSLACVSLSSVGESPFTPAVACLETTSLEQPHHEYPRPARTRGLDVG